MVSAGSGPSRRAETLKSVGRLTHEAVAANGAETLAVRKVVMGSFPDGIFPNITPDKATGIGQWSASDIVFVLKLGILPDGDFVSAQMVEVVEHGTSHLREGDLKSIAAYLKSVRPIRNKLLPTKK